MGDVLGAARLLDAVPQSTAATVAHAPRKAIPALTSLRFFAAAAIVLYHTNGSFGTAGCGNVLLGEQCSSYLLGLGVPFFFVLSGFILTYVYPSLEGAGARWRFLVARVARVWPTHIVTLLIALVMFFPVYQAMPGGFPFDALLANAFLVHAWIPEARYGLSFNSPSWTISTEVGFYLCFLVLIQAWQRTWRWKLALALALALLFVTLPRLLKSLDGPQQGMGTEVGPSLGMNPLAQVFVFTLGMTTALTWRHFRDRLRYGVRAGTVIEAVTVVLALGYVIGRAALLPPARAVPGLPEVWVRWLIGSAGTYPAFALIIGVLALERGAISRVVLAWRPLVLLGEISFSMYLLHNFFTFHYGSHQQSFDAVPGWLGYAVYWLLVLCASFLMWRLVEIPCRRWIVGLSRPGAWRRLRLSPRALLRGIVPRRDVAFVAVAFMALLVPVGYARETYPLPRYLTAAEGAAATLRGVPEVRAVRFGPTATTGDAAPIALVGVETQRTEAGVVIQFTWHALAAQTLGQVVFVHLLDGDGTYLTQGNFVQSLRKHRVERDAYWRDTTTVALTADQRVRARQVGVGLYDPYAVPTTYTYPDSGPRDSGGVRLLLPLTDGTGRVPPHSG